MFSNRTVGTAAVVVGGVFAGLGVAGSQGGVTDYGCVLFLLAAISLYCGFWLIAHGDRE